MEKVVLVGIAGFIWICLSPQGRDLDKQRHTYYPAIGEVKQRIILYIQVHKLYSLKPGTIFQKDF